MEKGSKRVVDARKGLGSLRVLLKEVWRKICCFVPSGPEITKNEGQRGGVRGYNASALEGKGVGKLTYLDDRRKGF